METQKHRRFIYIKIDVWHFSNDFFIKNILPFAETSPPVKTVLPALCKYNAYNLCINKFPYKLSGPKFSHINGNEGEGILLFMACFSIYPYFYITLWEFSTLNKCDLNGFVWLLRRFSAKFLECFN